MSDGLMQLELALEPTARLSGARLEHLELYNWGTFHGQVWRYELAGETSLLTGDIGSGKSTLVDAVTSLLVPPQRIQFNRAAGADKDERSLRSYFLGYYKSARPEEGPTGRPVTLRDHNHYSVILGVFRNRGFGQTITLAQFFYMKETGGQPARFYLVADQELSVAKDFSGFGTVANLRKRLRSQKVNLYDSFPQYSAAFRRRFGIPTEQALELFHQTVSMKSVTNLTDFVRRHMLEKFPVRDRIQALIGHYENLNRAHEAVLKAREQIEHLTPLVADCDRHTRLLERVAELRDCRAALRAYFSGLKAELLESRLERLTQEAGKLQSRIDSTELLLSRQERERADLTRAIAENGGDRIERLAADIKEKTLERKRRMAKFEYYAELVKSLGLAAAESEPAFVEQNQSLQKLNLEKAATEADLQNQQTELLVELKERRREHDALVAELESLKKRRSNIERTQIEIRRELCRALELRESELPYAGELLAVKEDERDWEGAAERLLRSFALSLLVPDRHYARVAEWVNRTRLRGRLVYFRVLERNEAPTKLAAHSLVYKLAIKPDTELQGWLRRELSKRFDYACCDSLEQFRRERKAVTSAGQIKSPGERHEKDDRHALEDRSRYVLGWSNEEKIRALDLRRVRLEKEIAALGGRVAELQTKMQRLAEERHTLTRLGELREFRQIDWKPLAREIADLEAEKRKLESSSNVLQELARKLSEVEKAVSESRSQLEDHRGDLKVNQHKVEAAGELLQECRAQQQLLPLDDQALARLEQVRQEGLGEHQLSVESCDNRERDLRDWITSRIDNEDSKIKRLRDKILTAMAAFCTAHPLETQEVDVAVESGPEFAAMLERLNSDDLPRFEEKFKQLLNENTIREIANFQSQLARECETIKERVHKINLSLQEIDYNPGRYIRLELQKTTDAEIRDFHTELRACTEGALTGSDEEQYSESKFLKVRSIIERFQGREGTSELDRRWTRKVTDVRNWFTFSASERWKEDDVEYEHYTDSGGKSGGQKEKLAYTILAASLAYQFGLEVGAARTRTFHFVMIDEAFGRASDDSTRYGLELFKKLDLQLLIVTPLQKLHVIEEYVASVGFLHNSSEGCHSQLLNLTIEEYQKKKQEARVDSPGGPSQSGA